MTTFERFSIRFGGSITSRFVDATTVWIFSVFVLDESRWVARIVERVGLAMRSRK